MLEVQQIPLDFAAWDYGRFGAREFHGCTLEKKQRTISPASKSSTFHLWLIRQRELGNRRPNAGNPSYRGQPANILTLYRWHPAASC
jgi:hypothetical protein